MKLVAVYLLIAVAVFHKSYESQIALKEYGKSRAPTFLDYKNRAADCKGVTGSICSDEYKDCNTTYLCLTEGGPPIPVNCPKNESCNAGKCDKNSSPLCEFKGLTFKCSTEGMYPEPSSCKKYNYCVPGANNQVNPKPIPGTCPTGWGYNPANTFCDKKLINNNCADVDRAVPQCKEMGKNEALKANPVLFYICLPHDDDTDTLYPLILKCPDNKKFVGNLQCK